jgi:hypothetical protein
MATTASKGPEAGAEEDAESEVGSAVRSVAEEPRRSPAVREGAPVLLVEDWTWEAAKSLGGRQTNK